MYFSLSVCVSQTHTFPPPMQEARERVTHSNVQSRSSHSQVYRILRLGERGQDTENSHWLLTDTQALRGGTDRLPYVWLLSRLHSKCATSF